MSMTIETTADAAAAGLGRGGRMSRQRKREAVLRLLRGEDLELISRSLGVTAATLSGWRDAFLAAGEASLATRPLDRCQRPARHHRRDAFDQLVPPIASGEHRFEIILENNLVRRLLEGLAGEPGSVSLRPMLAGLVNPAMPQQER